MKKSGTSRKKPWKFFDQLDRIFKDNPSIEPKHLLDTSQEENQENYRGVLDQVDEGEKSDIDDDEEESCEESGMLKMNLLCYSHK